MMPVENGEHGNWLCSEMKHTDGILLSTPCYLSVMYTDVFWDTFRRFTHACCPQLLRWKLHKPRGWKTTQEKLNITVSDMCDHPKCLSAVRCAPFRLWNVPILRMRQDSHTGRCGLTSIKHRNKKKKKRQCIWWIVLFTELTNYNEKPEEGWNIGQW